jgi:hypothetical protein
LKANANGFSKPPDSGLLIADNWRVVTLPLASWFDCNLRIPPRPAIQLCQKNIAVVDYR